MIIIELISLVIMSGILLGIFKILENMPQKSKMPKIRASQKPYKARKKDWKLPDQVISPSRRRETQLMMNDFNTAYSTDRIHDDFAVDGISATIERL